MSPVLALVLGLALCVVDNLARRRLSVAEVVGVVLAVYGLAALLG